jgi:hypothetical protein
MIFSEFSLQAFAIMRWSRRLSYAVAGDTANGIILIVVVNENLTAWFLWMMYKPYLTVP